jgi:DNA-binding MarR family transcriptional regulator
VAERKQGRGQALRASDAMSIEQLLDYKIGQLRKLLDRYSSPAVSEQFGLSLAEWRMLSHIQAGGSVTAFWLCRRLQADRAEVSRACASLVRRGYVASKPNPADARSALLELTRSGHAIFRRIMPVRLELQKELTGALDRHELTILYGALDKLNKVISDKMAQIGTPTRTKRAAAGRRAMVRTATPRRPREPARR